MPPPSPPPPPPHTHTHTHTGYHVREVSHGDSVPLHCVARPRCPGQRNVGHSIHPSCSQALPSLPRPASARSLQCWCWSDRDLYHSGYDDATNEGGGDSQYLPVREEPPLTENEDGAITGWSVHKTLSMLHHLLLAFLTEII